MRDHDDGQDDARDDVADDHLNEHDVGAVGDGGDADDGECARLGGDDGDADAPPRDVAAAEEVVAGVALVFAEPDAEANDTGEVGDDDEPVGEIEVAVHAGLRGVEVKKRGREGRRETND